MKKPRRLEKQIPEYESASDDGSPEISDCDDDYTEVEKKLLNKTRPKAQENFDSEDEVFGFSDNEDDHDSLQSDIEGMEEDDDLPNEKAWGKKKQAYHSTDYVDPDYSTTSEKGKIIAEMEEQEARNIQKRLMEQLDEADFGFDLVTPKKTETSEQEQEEKEIVKTDLSKLSSRQKRELLEKDSPELAPIVSDIQDRFDEVINILNPFLKTIAVEQDNINPAVVKYVKLKYKLLLNYFTYGNFYLMLKAKRLPIQSHPVIKRLAQCRQLLGQLESIQGNLLDEIKEALENKTALLSSVKTETNIPKKQKTSKLKNKKVKVYENRFEVTENLEDDKMSDKMETEETPEDGDEIGKRAISYEITKNRGLTPYRKKELRNPRVKHRNKYRKATIRRKGAVRKVRTETARYDGELSGIKANVIKSIKIK